MLEKVCLTFLSHQFEMNEIIRILFSKWIEEMLVINEKETGNVSNNKTSEGNFFQTNHTFGCFIQKSSPRKFNGSLVSLLSK